MTSDPPDSPGTDTRSFWSPGIGAITRVGLAAWAVIGVVIVAALVFAALVKVSSVVLPLLGGVGLAVILSPAEKRLRRLGLPAAVASAAIVLLFVAVAVAMVWMTTSGVVRQAGAIGDTVRVALHDAGVDQSTVDQISTALQDAEPMITKGFVSAAIGGLSALSSFGVGALLGSLVLYYVLKDGTVLGDSALSLIRPERRDATKRLGATSASLLRSYALARSAVSAVVALCIGAVGLVLGLPLIGTIVVVNFLGGYVPYVGAVLGGGLAVIVAFADGGPGAAVAMLVAVFASNLVVENFVEPPILGRSLGIHPLMVLLVTAAGGVLGGLIGLMVAVPLFLVARAGLQVWWDTHEAEEGPRPRGRTRIGPEPHP